MALFFLGGDSRVLYGFYRNPCVIHNSGNEDRVTPSFHSMLLLLPDRLRVLE